MAHLVSPGSPRNCHKQKPPAAFPGPLSSHAPVHVPATCSADYHGKGQSCNCSPDLSVCFLLCNLKQELTQSSATDFYKAFWLHVSTVWAQNGRALACVHVSLLWNPKGTPAVCTRDKRSGSSTQQPPVCDAPRARCRPTWWEIIPSSHNLASLGFMVTLEGQETGLNNHVCFFSVSG